MFDITCFVDFRPCFKSFASLDNYIIQPNDLLTNMVTNSENNFMEDDMSKQQMKYNSKVLQSYFKVHFQFQKMLL